jgi:hypothetical protein
VERDDNWLRLGADAFHATCADRTDPTTPLEDAHYVTG